MNMPEDTPIFDIFGHIVLFFTHNKYGLNYTIFSLKQYLVHTLEGSSGALSTLFNVSM